MRTTTNRTLWPVTGGAIALQPGWFQGHATAFFYMNLGFGTNGPDNGPPNMSFPMVPVFQIVGPSKNPYPGTICLPQVPLPSGAVVNIGDNATIQVVETAIHGAALYSVSPPKPLPSAKSVEIQKKKKLIQETVRRYHLRRPQRRSRGKRDKLLQLLRHLLQQRLLHRSRLLFLSAEIIRISPVITDGARGDDVDDSAVSERAVRAPSALYELHEVWP
jgi:hypothetical protein